jgi:hypothetical protein
MRAAHHTSADTQSTPFQFFFSLLGVGCGKGQNKTVSFAGMSLNAISTTLEGRFPKKVNKLPRKCINAERKSC